MSPLRSEPSRRRGARASRPAWPLTPALLALCAAASAQAPDPGAAEPVTLAPVEVRARSAAPAASAPGRAATTSNRLGTGPMETARSITVVPRETLDAQAALTEKDVLRNVAGVSSYSEYYGAYSLFAIRGLNANNSYNFLRDGAKFLHLVDPPLFNIEQVEVLKGPAALEFGQVAPGGLVNYVSKKPLDEPLRSVRLGAGSYGLTTAEIDLTGPIDDDRTLTYRLTGAVSRGGSFVDRIDPQKNGLAGTIAWKITPDTRVSAQLEYSDFSAASYAGLAVPNPKDPTSANAIDIHRNYGEAGLKTDGYLAFAFTELTHRFSPDLDARVYLSRNETFRNVLLPYSFTVTGSSVARNYYLAPGQRFDSDTALAELHARANTGPVAHRIAAGVDYRTLESRYGQFGGGRLSAVDLYDPSPSGEALPAAGGSSQLASDARNTGVFLQDRLEWNGWGLLLGVRHDRFKDDRLTPVQEFDKTLPTVALTVHPTDDLLLYVSQTQSFQANSGTLLVGNVAAPPSAGRQLEIGAKKEWLDRRLFTTLAVYDLELTNAPTTDPSNPTYSVVTGKQRVRGVEVELTGRLQDDWDLTAQASFMDPRVTSSNTPGVSVGNRVVGATRRTASVWTRYRLPQLPGLWIGAGMNYQGDKFIANDNLLRLPGYLTADAAIGCRLPGGVRLQVNVKNLANRRYYIDGTSNAAGFSTVVPGAPRTVYATADVSF